MEQSTFTKNHRALFIYKQLNFSCFQPEQKDLHIPREWQRLKGRNFMLVLVVFHSPKSNTQTLVGK